jgi:hypothetical protein
MDVDAIEAKAKADEAAKQPRKRLAAARRRQPAPTAK